MAVRQTGNPYNAGVDANNWPSLTALSGTAGTADTAGTAEIIALGGNPTTGALYVQDLSSGAGTTTVQMVSGTLNVGTVVVSSSSGGTTVNIATGTQQTLGTVGLVNGLVTGTITTGSLSNVAMLNAGTVVTASGTVTLLSTVTTLSNLTNGSINVLSGTQQLLTTVSNLTNGSVNLLTGTVTSVTSVANIVTGTLASVRVNHTPVGSILVYSNTLGTAGAAFWGTLVAPVGAGTFLYLTNLSIVGVSGTVDCGIANNVAGSTGAGVIARGFFPPSGGIAQNFDPPITTVANGTLAYFLNGAGTVDFNVAYWVSP
mgnify:FL=1